METTKKLDLEKISRYLRSVYADKLVGFEMVKDAALYRVGLLGKQPERYVFAVAVIFAGKDNPQSQLQLLYYPIANETALETSAILSENTYSNKKEFYSKYVKLCLRHGEYFQEWRGFCGMPEDIDDARARLNARLLFSSDEELQREAFVPNKKMIPYHSASDCGYLYRFAGQKKTRTYVVHEKCEELSLQIEALTMLSSPCLVPLASGKIYYFTGSRFVVRQGGVLTKDETRSYFEDIVKQANEKQWRHVHVVTHYENVFSLLNRENDVSYSKWIVRQADNWEKMLSDEHFAFVDVLPKRRAGVLDVVNLNAEYPRNTAIAKSGMDEDDYKLTLKVGHRLLELLSKPQDYAEVVEELESRWLELSEAIEAIR